MLFNYGLLPIGVSTVFIMLFVTNCMHASNHKDIQDINVRVKRREQGLHGEISRFGRFSLFHISNTATFAVKISPAYSHPL